MVGDLVKSSEMQEDSVTAEPWLSSFLPLRRTQSLCSDGEHATSSCRPAD